MIKPLIAMAILSTMSVPAVAQTIPASPSAQPATAQQAKPQTIKKRVCEKTDADDSYSRLGTHKVCHTVIVNAKEGSEGGEAEQGRAPR
jgi:hypothetical protein